MFYILQNFGRLPVWNSVAKIKQSEADRQNKTGRQDGQSRAERGGSEAPEQNRTVPAGTNLKNKRMCPEGPYGLFFTCR